MKAYSKIILGKGGLLINKRETVLIEREMENYCFKKVMSRH
jgi:hypothetical protein